MVHARLDAHTIAPHRARRVTGPGSAGAYPRAPLRQKVLLAGADGPREIAVAAQQVDQYRRPAGFGDELAEQAAVVVDRGILDGIELREGWRRAARQPGERPRIAD